MEHLWKKLEEWLAQNWPEGLSSLNAPATTQQIDELEFKLQAKLPSDFVACLKIHNGQSGFLSFFDGMEFLSCEEIYSQWAVWNDLNKSGEFKGILSAPEPGIKNDWWNSKWIPFTHNGGGDHLCLDLAPSQSGSTGQVITMWHDMEARELQAKSFQEYFQYYVEGVLSGKYIYSEEYGGLIDANDV
ncbi:SMI1/KNR4 family protein [Photobacterium leiognathi]|uniref:SMI1/KNR4 family protein n=1 Tax=Photobacterium leiognathi TaxID=553611 RepID=UPI0027399259|nr:SMI1/KNR4 family protein [Photobacterium leiognathi]